MSGWLMMFNETSLFDDDQSLWTSTNVSGSVSSSWSNSTTPIIVTGNDSTVSIGVTWMMTQSNITECLTPGVTQNRTLFPTSGGGGGMGTSTPGCISIITPLEAAICVLLAVLILAIIIGNVFVVLSVLIFDKMRTLSNGLIVSLASADLLVAIVVLPFSLQHEVIGQWTLGPFICDLWITSDVFCCTASILNIVVIALDRYWLITRHVRYTHSAILPRKKVCLVMMSLAWVVAGLISASPLLGWRRGTERLDPTECLISQDYSYTIFSTFGAFWVPLIVILAVYFKIFHFARQRATRRTKPYEQTYVEASIAIDVKETLCPVTPQSPLDTPFPPQPVASAPLPPMGHASRGGPFSEAEFTTLDPGGRTQVNDRETEFRPASMISRSRRGHRSRSMRRSARTLGLIIGGFLVCWMPFFIVATVDPFCPDCRVPRLVRSFVLWLGYSNSLLNPAIYAIWDKSFRRSFKRLGTCDLR